MIPRTLAICVFATLMSLSTSDVSAGRLFHRHAGVGGCSQCGQNYVGYTGHHFHRGVATSCCGGLAAVSGTVATHSAGYYGGYYDVYSGYEGLPDMDGRRFSAWRNGPGIQSPYYQRGVHYRFPYHSYRRPWHHPGPASANVTIVW